jgi:hypothetical protein
MPHPDSEVRRPTNGRGGLTAIDTTLTSPRRDAGRRLDDAHTLGRQRPRGAPLRRPERLRASIADASG